MRTVALPVDVDTQDTHAEPKEEFLKVMFPRIRMAE
jgi:hypothetical protein